MTLNAVTSRSNTFFMYPKGLSTRHKKMKAKKNNNNNVQKSSNNAT